MPQTVRKILAIAGSSLRRTARDRKALALQLLMPMVLIGILGAALGSMFELDAIERLDVLVINEDEGAQGVNLGDTFVNQVLGSEEVRAFLQVTPAADLAAARERVASGQVVAAIWLPPSFSRAAFRGEPVAMAIWTDPGRPRQGEIVAAVARRFTDGVDAVNVALHLGLDLQVQGFTGGLEATAPEIRRVPSGTRTVPAMAYYAAAMGVMFMIMTAFTRARDLIEERQQGTLARMLVTPTTRGTILAGQILGTLSLLLAQFLLLYLGTRFLYGVQWGPLAGVLTLGGALSLAAAGISTAVAAWVDNPRAADASIGVVGNLFAALSGGMYPIYLFPDSMKALARLIPNYWGLTGFIDLMAGLGMGAVVLPATVLTAIGLASGLLGTLRLRVAQR